MEYRYCFEQDDFDGIPQLEQKRVLWSQLIALVRFNVAWLAPRRGRTPLLYRSGVTFEREPDGALNMWSNIPACLRRGRSHCVGLSCWRMAELQLQGVRAAPCIQVFKEERPGFGLVTEFHVSVMYTTDERLGVEPEQIALWDHEDPARLLGMK